MFFATILACADTSVVKAIARLPECGPQNEQDCYEKEEVCIPTGGVVSPYSGGMCLPQACKSDKVIVSGIGFSVDDPQFAVLQAYQDDINGVYTRVNDASFSDDSYFDYRREVNTNGTGVFGPTVQLLMGTDAYGWAWQGSWIFQFQQGSSYFLRSSNSGPDPTMVGSRFGSVSEPEQDDYRAMELTITCDGW